MTAQTRLLEQASNRAVMPGAERPESWLMRDLHDKVAQPLWYLTMELPALRGQLPPDMEELRRRIEVLEQVAREGYQQLRTVLNKAKPHSDAGISLRSLVRKRVAAFRRRTGVPVDTALPSDDTVLRQPVAQHVSAVLQEALWNSWKHACGRGLRVTVEVQTHAAAITVTDSGPGCDRLVSPEGHFGLSGMSARAAAIGGKLQFRSSLGRGTRVRLSLPTAA